MRAKLTGGTRRFSSCAVPLAFYIISFTATAAETNARAAYEAALTVTPAMVKTTELIRTISATGSIYPWQEIVIGPEVGGYRVSAVTVDVGDRVKGGQELVRLAGD